MKTSILEDTIKKFIIFDLPLETRVHPLKSFLAPHSQCYIKRDDELGLMGSKMRKFSSLLTHLVQQETREAIVIGSANSNHVLGISQLLIENKIRPQLFLCQTNQEKLQGNALLIKLLVPDHQIQWISRQEWHRVHEIATAYAEEKAMDKAMCIIPEGGCMAEALPGALTLACDIIRNEKQLGFQFSHFFIDSGTGLMALALILGLTYLQHPGHIHVVLMAGSEDEFMEKLKVFHHHFSKLINQNCDWPSNFSLSRPAQAKAFGATTSETFKGIRQIAQEEGILCDPLYNAKLLLEAKRKIVTDHLQGKTLVVQSGGTLSLLGFL